MNNIMNNNNTEILYKMGENSFNPNRNHIQNIPPLRTILENTFPGTVDYILLVKTTYFEKYSSDGRFSNFDYPVNSNNLNNINNNSNNIYNHQSNSGTNNYLNNINSDMCTQINSEYSIYSNSIESINSDDSNYNFSFTYSFNASNFKNSNNLINDCPEYEIKQDSSLSNFPFSFSSFNCYNLNYCNNDQSTTTSPTQSPSPISNSFNDSIEYCEQ